MRRDVRHWDADRREEGSNRDACQEPQQTQSYAAEITEHETAARGKDTSTGTGQEPPGRLMGGTQLPAEFSGRPKASQGFAYGPLWLKPFGFERGYRVMHVIDELGPHFGDVGRRQPKLRGHPIEEGGYFVSASLRGRDRGNRFVRSVAESAFAAPNQRDRSDQKRTPAAEEGKGE
jgi:hypothetical protein